MGRKPSCICGECPACVRRLAGHGMRWYLEHREEAIARARLNRATNPDVQARDRERSKDPKRRALNTEMTKRHRRRHPLANAAHCAVQRAIKKGSLVRQPCEVCGAQQTYAHHDDYAKALEVRWLCPRHHSLHHHHVPFEKEPEED